MASNIMGNKVLPGIVDGEFSRALGSLWLSGSAKNYFEVVTIAGKDSDEGNSVPFATIVKQTGFNTYTPLAVADIASLNARLGVIVDESFVYGTEDDPLTANIGLRGVVDQSQLLVGDTAFDDLTDANKLALKNIFYKGGIELKPVYYA